MSIRHETIYKSVCQDKGKGENLYRNLRCQKKRRRLYRSGRQIIISNCVSSDDRPDSVNLKSVLGIGKLIPLFPTGKIKK